MYRTLCKLSYRLKFVLIGQNRTTNQRSGMILEVQIQFFDQNNNCVFIVLKAKTGKKLRTKIGWLPKRTFLSFEIKNVKKHFSSYFSFVLAL